MTHTEAARAVVYPNVDVMDKAGGIGDTGERRAVVDVVLPVEEFRVRLEVEEVPFPPRFNQ